MPPPRLLLLVCAAASALLSPSPSLSAQAVPSGNAVLHKKVELPLGGPGEASVLVEVDRRERLSPQEFWSEYASRGVPVVVTDVLDFFPRPWIDGVAAKLARMTAAELAEYEPPSVWEGGTKGCIDGRRLPALNLPEKPYFARIDSPAEPDDVFHSQPGLVFWAKAGIPFGGHAHIDDSCHSTFSMQFTGRKHWWVWPPLWPGDVDRPRRARTVYRAVVDAGEMLVFYSCMRHGTSIAREGGHNPFNLSNPEQGLSVAIAHYFALPPPYATSLSRPQLRPPTAAEKPQCPADWRERAARWAAMGRVEERVSPPDPTGDPAGARAWRVGRVRGSLLSPNQPARSTFEGDPAGLRIGGQFAGAGDAAARVADAATRAAERSGGGPALLARAEALAAALLGEGHHWTGVESFFRDVARGAGAEFWPVVDGAPVLLRLPALADAEDCARGGAVFCAQQGIEDPAGESGRAIGRAALAALREAIGQQTHLRAVERAVARQLERFAGGNVCDAGREAAAAKEGGSAAAAKEGRAAPDPAPGSAPGSAAGSAPDPAAAACRTAWPPSAHGARYTLLVQTPHADETGPPPAGRGERSGFDLGDFLRHYGALPRLHEVLVVCARGAPGEPAPPPCDRPELGDAFELSHDATGRVVPVKLLRRAWSPLAPTRADAAGPRSANRHTFSPNDRFQPFPEIGTEAVFAVRGDARVAPDAVERVFDAFLREPRRAGALVGLRPRLVGRRPGGALGFADPGRAFRPGEQLAGHGYNMVLATSAMFGRELLNDYACGPAGSRAAGPAAGYKMLLDAVDGYGGGAEDVLFNVVAARRRAAGGVTDRLSAPPPLAFTFGGGACRSTYAALGGDCCGGFFAPPAADPSAGDEAEGPAGPMPGEGDGPPAIIPGEDGNGGYVSDRYAQSQVEEREDPALRWWQRAHVLGLAAGLLDVELPLRATRTAASHFSADEDVCGAASEPPLWAPSATG